MNPGRPVPSPSAILLGLFSQSWTSRALLAAANLGIADHVTDAPRDVAEIAADAKLDSDSLYRLMRGLASIGIFREEGDRRFVHTRLSSALRSDAPDSVRAPIRGFGLRSISQAWVELEHAIRTGGSTYELVHGSADPFEYSARHPEEAAVYNEAMRSVSESQTKAINEAFDFSGTKRLADIGGGHGAMIASILARNPQQRGVLFDLPHVVADAGPSLARLGVAERCEVRGGDFRLDLPADCDGYFLKNILHGWSDADAQALLARICQRARPGAHLFVVEMVVPPGNAADPSKSFDLFLLLGGAASRARTEAEFGALFARAGWRLLRVVRTTAGICVIEGERLTSPAPVNSCAGAAGR